MERLEPRKQRNRRSQKPREQRNCRRQEQRRRQGQQWLWKPERRTRVQRRWRHQACIPATLGEKRGPLRVLQEVYFIDPNNSRTACAVKERMIMKDVHGYIADTA
ncbi:hypothetical protein NDU88_004609 [Pleurodeles waltl]|uniref:Uncharacterized protein n=1 Tax=Pleurodeles waltl TaxID=8319 RepID=A0AAV7MV23_PLEWA|nr:hypothetical protein NDU88_004609 [Pleurodeles waltl]